MLIPRQANKLQKTHQQRIILHTHKYYYILLDIVKRFKVKMSEKKYMNISEVAKLLLISKHTVQAWLSPSSPNFKQEFSYLARHAGRRTLFEKKDIENWLNQRRGALYAQKYNEISPYWLEKFLELRGIFKNYIITPTENKKLKKRDFIDGALGIDTEPLLIWLTDAKLANTITTIVTRAEKLIISVPLCFRILKQVKNNQSVSKKMKKLLLEDRIFELADFNEHALLLANDIPSSISELSVINYISCISKGANSFLTRNSSLSKLATLKLTIF